MMAENPWQYANDAAKEALGNDVMAHFAGGTKIKENPVRQVWMCGKFFFKFDSRGLRRLHREFVNGVELERSGIPVVKHLACGMTPMGGCLITRALHDSISLDQLIQYAPPEQEVLSALGKLLTKMRNARIRHLDFHTGNLLYARNEKQFYLCDVRDACVSRFWHFRRFSLAPYWKLIADLRCYLPLAELFPLLKENGVRKPEKELYRIMQQEAASLSKEWNKRKNQVLSGNSKFTTSSGSLILVRNISAGTALAGERVSGTSEVFANAFFLDLAHLPHRQVFAWDQESQQLYLEEEPSFPADPERIREYIRRAAVSGLHTTPEMWKCDSRGQIKLIRWQNIFPERKES